MTDYRDILDFCVRRNPALIYVAIGCAQGHNSPQHRTAQQFPPFIRAPNGWPKGEVIAVLIDPALEPDTELQGLIDADGDPEVAFLTARQEFHWDNPRDKQFIRYLCGMMMRTHRTTQLIVQDYTGEEIAGHLSRFMWEIGRGLQERALFDVSYGTMGGCFLDFSTVRILRNPDTGTFIQPQYMTLAQGIAHGVASAGAGAGAGEGADVAKPYYHIPVHYMRRIATERIQALRLYGHRTLRCLRDSSEERPPWLSDAAVLEKLSPIAYIYGIPLPTITPDRLTALLTHFMTDLATIADATVPIQELIAEPTSDDLCNAMYILRDTALGSRSGSG
ncbi:hypothetical protein EBZ80_17240 [bacterium]|nr:hypothetical protein [bacterium]